MTKPHSIANTNDNSDIILLRGRANVRTTLRSFAALASLVLPCVFVSSRSAATETIDNGAPVEINAPSEDIEVFDSLDPLPTTVNVVDGGQVGFALNGDGTIMMEDDGDGGMQPVLSNEDQSVGLFDNSIFNMTGGETASAILVSDSATATIAGGFVGGDINVERNGILIVNGASVPEPPEDEDPDPLSEGNLSIEGLGQATLSFVAFEEVGVGDNGVLNVQDDALIADVVELTNMAQLNMDGGTLDDDVILFDQSGVLMTGGEIGGDLELKNNSQAMIESGEVDTLVMSGNTMATITDGEVGEVEIVGTDETFETGFVAKLIISGGEYGPLAAFSPDQNLKDVVVDITGGAFEEGINIGGPGAVGTVSGVELETFELGQELVARNSAELTVDSGTGEEVEAEASFFGVLTINDLAADSLEISSIFGDAFLNGGSADALDINADRGSVFWSGGDFASVSIESVTLGIVEIFGSNFQIDGQPFAGETCLASPEKLVASLLMEPPSRPRLRETRFPRFG